jgi:signal transduction histidine kinase
LDSITVVRITIDDDGPGIPAEDLERVTERFYRVDSDRNSQTGGAGLGLALATETAHRHGGDLKLINLPRGLRAEVVMPARDVDVTARAMWRQINRNQRGSASSATTQVTER